MESNVLSWNAALEKGYEQRLNPYATDHVPLGEYEAFLDFKIWAKKAIAICCYFTKKGTGTRFQVTVYRRQEDELYRLDDGDIDFKLCPVNTVYFNNVNVNGKQKAVLKRAVLV